MHRLISRALAFFRRTDTELEKTQYQRLLEEDSRLKTAHGVVTNFCNDYGLIDESVHFNTDETGNMPLRIGQKVTEVVEEDKTSHGLNAIKVDAFSDNCHGEGPSDSHARVSFGCITSVMGGANYINHTIYFSLNVVCKDFEPYQGDRVEVEFAVQPDRSRKALLVKPLRHKHVYKVCITSVHGRHGVVDNTIFFTLDSLKLPAGYTPQPNDIVDVVIVESVQSCYIWRAVSMTPVHML